MRRIIMGNKINECEARDETVDRLISELMTNNSIDSFKLEYTTGSGVSYTFSKKRDSVLD
jgi:hypothetical protein